MTPAPHGSSAYTSFVNTSDGFDDCWDPFLTLYKRYWPQASAPLLLNTELKRYQGPHLDTRSTCVQQGLPKRLTWSECLLAGLNQVTTPLVLYFQEDYFLHRPVLHEKVEEAAAHMMLHPEVGHIALTAIGSHGPHLAYPDRAYHIIRQQARYRISTQVGLWRVDTLKSYLEPQENGWMFEIYGTWRARRRNDLFLCADFGEASGGPAFDYLHTGIIKGQWLPGIAEVFRANGIVIDYTRRGFYRPKHALRRKMETARRLFERPGYFLKQWRG